jgi:hypothetical protein
VVAVSQEIQEVQEEGHQCWGNRWEQPPLLLLWSFGVDSVHGPKKKKEKQRPLLL